MTKTRLAVLALAVAAGATVAIAQDEPKPTPLELGKPVDVTVKTDGEMKTFSIKVDARGPFRLSATSPGPDGTGYCEVRVVRDGVDVHAYHFEAHKDTTPFFPVLEKGEQKIQVGTAGGGDTVSVRIQLDRFEPVLGDETAKAARAAIDKATAWLEKTAPRDDYTHALGIEGITLGALSEGASPERKALLEKDWLPFFEAHLEETEGTWKGERVKGLSEAIYEAALATLGLAEAASNGSAKAKAMLPACVKYLLAAQVGPLRCKEWGPVAANDPAAGGWRYSPSSSDADISASGWCLVALIAASAADCKVDGLRDAIHNGVDFVLRCTADKTFGYTAGSAQPGDVRRGIGALICLLEGEEPESLPGVLDTMDDRLFVYSKIEDGDDYPLYYAYYATRANYLRGGFPWQVWRTTAIRQLLEHQAADGSFPGHGEEQGLDPRFATSLGTMILRICLEQVPAYLKREVRGF